VTAKKKKQGGPLHAKACVMVDVLRNSIYGIMYAFHDKMLMSTKAGLIEKD
jgi:nucleoporin NDC1